MKTKLMDRIELIIRKKDLDLSDLLIHKILTATEVIVTDKEKIKRDLSQVFNQLTDTNLLSYASSKPMTLLFSDSMNLVLIDYLGIERKAILYKDFYLLATTEEVDKNINSVIGKFMSIQDDDIKSKALDSLTKVDKSECTRIKTLDELDSLSEDDVILQIEDKYYLIYQDEITGEINTKFCTKDFKFIDIDLDTLNNYLVS